MESYSRLSITSNVGVSTAAVESLWVNRLT